MTVIRTHYIDASAIVKLFLKEQGSDNLRKYFNDYHTFHTTWLCFAETLGAFKKKFLNDVITSEEYFNACNDLIAWFQDEGIGLDGIKITDREIYSEVEELAQHYNLDIADAYLIVALKRGFFSTLTGGSRPMLITADKKLTEAARQENVHAWNCVTEPAP